MRRLFRLAAESLPPVTGNCFVTLDDNAASAAGDLEFRLDAAATCGDDTSLAFAVYQIVAAAFATAGDDTSLAYGLAGGSGGNITSQLLDDTAVVTGGQSFAGAGSPTTGTDSSSAVSVPFQSPIEILWEDQPTILWETGDVVEWDELYVIYVLVAGTAGPALASITGVHTPPPSAGGVIAATLGPATAGTGNAGKLIFAGTASSANGMGAAGQLAGNWSAADHVGQIQTTLAGDYSAFTGVLKFVGAITGSGSATGQILGPIIPIDGGGSTTTDGSQIFEDIEACTFVGDASPFEFVGKSPDYRFRGQACGSCA